MRGYALLLAAAASLSGCATTTGTTATDEAGPRQCFFASSVGGFRNAPRGESGSERIYVDVGVRDTYLFEVFGACPDLDFSNRIALVSRNGTNNICRGIDVDLIVPGPGQSAPQRCPVRMIRKLTPEERASSRT